MLPEGGATNFGLPPKGGGGQNFRSFPKGGDKFWTSPEGGGAQNFRLDLFFFSMFLKHIFFMFWGYFGHFSFFGLRGAKIFRRVAKGGERKILDASSRGGKKF